ncbi:M20 family metallopeptidase [Bounagaea algeriensis]
MRREPTTPDGSYLRSVSEATERAAAEAEPIASAFAGVSEATRSAVERWLDRHAAELVQLSHTVHDHPEEAFGETEAAARIADVLRHYGCPVDTGVGGLDTALRAEVGSGHPHVAVLAEYDALPGIGHGCGHNIIAASGVGGFLGAATAVDDLGGRISLVGTPAEEGGGGKELLAREGVFDDVDAVVMLHPFSHDIGAHPFTGRRQVEVVFHGIAAHAAAEPFMGRNALDALVATYQGVAALRQHLPPPDRVHGVITDGGRRPNVVPERAAGLFYLRSSELGALQDLAARFTAIADGAAEATGCGVELRWDPQPGYLPIRHNHALVGRWAQHQRRRGRTALPQGVVPEYLTGSTDLGNLSHRLPAIHPMLGLAGEGLALHTQNFATAARGESGDRAVVDGAVGLALTALDYLADEQLRGAVDAEFRAAGRVDPATVFDA